MKKGKIRLALMVIAVGILAAGTYVYADANDFQGNYRGHMMGYAFDGDDDSNSTWQGHMGGMMRGDYGNNNSNGWYGHGHMNGMMGSYEWDTFEDFDQDDLKSMDELKENVMDYLKNYEGDFEIDDIFVYSNSDYYFSIVNKETDQGAMELLVNPVTGYVYPEHGPNMMWNLEYGMHGFKGYGGMMRGFVDASDYEDQDMISMEEALEKANAYLEKVEDTLKAEEGGHAFKGYYTFHVNEGEALKGMMSVNAYTGDVWYHNWHGNLIEIISDDHE